MIWDALLTVVLGLIGTVVGLMPGGSPSDVSDLIAGPSSTVHGILLTFDAVLPIHEVMGFAATVFGLMVALYAYIAIRAVVRWIPVIGKGGG